MQPAPPSAIAPWRLAWLLRSDLRRGLPAAAPCPPWFRMWWIIEGRREYPAWNTPVPAELLAPMPEWPVHGQFGMSPALHYLIERREDLAKAFDVSTEQGLWQAIAWFYTHGMREYGMMDAASTELLAALDTVPPFLEDQDGTVPGCPAPTWLMFFVWRCSGDLQTQFDLRTKAGREGLLQWFCFEGIANLDLAPLVATRWRNWMHDTIRAGEAPAAAPRAAWLMWYRRRDLQQACDLGTEQGVRALARWAAQAWTSEPCLRWAKLPAPVAVSNVTAMPARPFGINLIGFAFGELGIGEDVRMAVAACEAAGIPFAVVNIHPGSQLRQADQALAGHVASARQGQDEAPYAVNLFCLTGFDTARVLLERGPGLFSGRVNAGWWPWELPVWPRDWDVVFDIMDCVWAATRFTQTMYTNSARRAAADGAATPVVWMPMPASVSRVTPMTRSALRLPPSRFLFLYVFDFNSYLARKNPFAAVKAFRQAFADGDESVGLVLKTMNSNPNNPQWKRFVRECAKDARVTLLDRTMERGEVLGLIASCDAYLSLHRSEGFGRTLAEAMLFGKPVVGTDFSGNVDFLTPEIGFPVKWKRVAVAHGDYPFVTEADGAWWAEPDLADAARQMRAARASAGAPAAAGHILRIAQQQFSPARIGALMRVQLEALFARAAA